MNTNVQAQVNALAQLTEITNKHVDDKMSTDEKATYNQACMMIADELQGKSASEIMSSATTALNDVMDAYNIGKAVYERRNWTIPSFEDLVGVGRAMKIYEKSIAEDGLQTIPTEQ